MHRRHSLLLFILALLIVACAPQLPSDVLSERRMEDVLVDYHLAQGIYETQGGGEEMRYKLLQSVFKKHRITEAQFDTSMLWYSTNSERLMEIYARVDQRIQARVTQLSDAGNQPTNSYQQMASEGDTCNIWTLPTHVTIQPLPLQNLYRFSFEADSTYRAGDTFMWHLRADNHVQEALQDVIVQLFVTYANDSVVSETKTIYGDQEANVRLYPNESFDTLMPRRVSGFVYMPLQRTDDTQKFHLVMLHDMALVRMHRQVQNSVTPSSSDSVAADSVADSTSTLEELVDSSAMPVRRTPAEVRDAKPHQSFQNIQKIRPVAPIKGKKTERRMRR